MEGTGVARIVFMGTPGFAVPTLNALVNAGHEVVAVVTAPDRPAGRGRQPRASEVKLRAMELGLPVWQPEKLKDPVFLANLDQVDADLYIVVAFRMLPREVWARPRWGTMNLHASLLPQYRGAAPINWAVINGEQRSGITTFLIGATIDTGDLLLQKEMPIGPDETAGELHDRMMSAGAELMVRTVAGRLNGDLHPTPQQVSNDLRAAPKLHAGTGRIDPSLEARRVHDLVRGLSPYPGAWCQVEEGRLKVLRTAMTSTPVQGMPGDVWAWNGQLMLCCGDGLLELLEVQAEGRKRMSGADFVRGLQQATLATARPIMHMVRSDPSIGE